MIFRNGNLGNFVLIEQEIMFRVRILLMIRFEATRVSSIACIVRFGERSRNQYLSCFTELQQSLHDLK